MVPKGIIVQSLRCFDPTILIPVPKKIPNHQPPRKSDIYFCKKTSIHIRFFVLEYFSQISREALNFIFRCLFFEWERERVSIQSKNAASETPLCGERLIQSWRAVRFHSMFNGKSAYRAANRTQMRKSLSLGLNKRIAREKSIKW